MSKVKNQHYVPQCYLKNFTLKKSDSVFIFDKINNESRHQSIKNISAERYFYDMVFDEILKDLDIAELDEKNCEIFQSIDRQFVEKFFSKIEVDFSRELKNIISLYNLIRKDKYLDTVVIDSKHKEKLSRLLSYQVTRTKEFRENVTQTLKLKLKTLLEEYLIMEKKDINLDNIKIQIPKQAVVLFQNAFLLDEKNILELSKILNNHIWVIGVNVTKQPFYTSDNPIVKWCHKEDEIVNGFGFKSKGVEIAFPINSKLILSMFDKSYFRDWEYLEGHFYRISDEENVKCYNSLQINQSYRQVYCTEDKFELCKYICNQNPNVRNQNRKRVIKIQIN